MEIDIKGGSHEKKDKKQKKKISEIHFSHGNTDHRYVGSYSGTGSFLPGFQQKDQGGGARHPGDPGGFKYQTSGVPAEEKGINPK